MSQRFAVVHEAEADFQTATELADRVLMEAIDWLDEDLIIDQREWVGTMTVDRGLTWKAIPRLAREIGIKARGHFDGRPGEADAAAARRAILYLKVAIPDLNAIVLVRDQDDQPERGIGLEQARGEHHGTTVIVVHRCRPRRRGAGSLGDQRVRPAGRRGDGPARRGATDSRVRSSAPEPRTDSLQKRSSRPKSEARPTAVVWGQPGPRAQLLDEHLAGAAAGAGQRERPCRVPAGSPGPPRPVDRARCRRMRRRWPDPTSCSTPLRFPHRPASAKLFGPILLHRFGACAWTGTGGSRSTRRWGRW